MKMLSRQTSELIDRISAIDYFKFVGKNDGARKRVSSWHEAARGLRSRQWTRLEDKVINYLENIALKPFREGDPDRWDYVSDVNQRLDLVARKLWEIISVTAGRESPNVHAEVVVHLRWACIETHFSASIPIHFYSERVFPIYESGHLPCGWYGAPISQEAPERWKPEIPNGDIVVF